MLQGFPEYKNTITEVTLSNPKDLNQYPTVTNLFDVAKQLNGVGELGNSFFGEAWADSMSTALFEHEKLMAIAAAGIEVTDYPLNGESNLSKGLNAIANHMLSREFRNVNRDIFVLRQGGFDMHHSSDVSLCQFVKAISFFAVIRASPNIFASTHSSSGIGPCIPRYEFRIGEVHQ